MEAALFLLHQAFRAFLGWLAKAAPWHGWDMGGILLWSIPPVLVPRALCLTQHPQGPWPCLLMVEPRGRTDVIDPGFWGSPYDSYPTPRLHSCPLLSSTGTYVRICCPSL